MGPPKFSEVVVIRYIYVPKMTEYHYEIKMKSRSFSASGSVGHVSDWYGRIIFRERYLLPPKSKVLFSEWRAHIGDEELFRVGNIRYDQVVLILGAELCYWVYFKTNLSARREEGTGVLDSSFCGCCVNEQYLNILRAARKLNVNIK